MCLSAAPFHLWGKAGRDVRVRRLAPPLEAEGAERPAGRLILQPTDNGVAGVFDGLVDGGAVGGAGESAGASVQ